MILKKPFAFVEIRAVRIKVKTAVSMTFQSPPVTKPALPTALAARPRPITAIIGADDNRRKQLVNPVLADETDKNRNDDIDQTDQD